MKVHAIGIARNNGISVKKDPKGKAYDMCALLVLTAIEPGSGQTKDGGNYARSGYGFQVTEFPAQPECIEQFKDVKFPAIIDVATDSEPMFGRMQTVVSGLISPVVTSVADYTKARAA